MSLEEVAKLIDDYNAKPNNKENQSQILPHIKQQGTTQRTF